MSKSGITVDIKKDWPLINLLGEVCWGFEVSNFDRTFGVKYAVVEKLLKNLIKLEKTESPNIILDQEEVAILKIALSLVEKEIDEWEFETRIGVSLENVKNITLFQKK